MMHENTHRLDSGALFRLLVSLLVRLRILLGVTKMANRRSEIMGMRLAVQNESHSGEENRYYG